jgi:pimeloyl-ACP methyl ester carboxylesterase
MGVVGSDGVVGRNNVVLCGRADGPVVMLAHGFGCDQNLWRRVVPGLERDFRVVLFDHVGAGHSMMPGTGVGSARPISMSCSTRWTATTWAGPPPWRR